MDYVPVLYAKAENGSYVGRSRSYTRSSGLTQPVRKVLFKAGKVSDFNTKLRYANISAITETMPVIAVPEITAEEFPEWYELAMRAMSQIDNNQVTDWE